MNKKDTFYFIGFQATGKTTIAKKLAKELSIPVWDTDEEIKKIYKKSPSEIILQNGEHYFRWIETNILFYLTLNSSQKKIISTGGGIIFNPINLYFMFLYGTCIYLKASVYDIQKRIQKSPIKRFRFYPNLSLKEEIQLLLKKRLFYYHLLKDHTYNTSLYSIDFIVKNLKNRLSKI